MAKSRRMVSVREGDAALGGYVWGYGVLLVARLAGIGEQRVREAMAAARGQDPPLNPTNPLDVVAWALTVRGHSRLANRVRKVLAGEG